MMPSDRDTKRVWKPALAHSISKPVIAVVMGVSGSGKTTVSVLLSAALGCQFQEGDDLHPAANVEKMRSGIPLNDADRLPWLHKIAEEIDGWRRHGESGVLTCSALKRSYRDIIIGDRSDVALVYLKGSRDLIHRRMAARHEHFMPLALLDSQFATLRNLRQTSIRSPSMSSASPLRSRPRSSVNLRNGKITAVNCRRILRRSRVPRRTSRNDRPDQGVR